MMVSLQNFKMKEALPRILADAVIVQLAAILSLCATFVYYIYGSGGDQLSRQFFLGELQSRYLHQFPTLAAVFLLVFSLSGVYTRTRGYSVRYKWPVLFRACGLASLLYLSVSLLIDRDGLLPRSTLVLLPLLTSVGVVGARWLNYWLESTRAIEDSVAAADTSNAEAPVLVVGGAGYIGSIVVRKLLDRGRRVRLLDKLSYGDSAIADLFGHANLEFITGDCRNIQDVVRSMSGVRDVIHLAAIVGDPACAADDKNALEINYAATRMMLEIAKGHGVQKFLFASSCSVYGASDSVMDEQSKTVPISLYAETKLNSEKVLLDAKSETFHPVVLRFATVFGLAPRPRFDLVVNLLTAKAFQEGIITIFNGDQWRPFIHVDDIAEAVCETLVCPVERVSGQILNVGDDRLNYTLSQIATLIHSEFPGTRIEHVENADRRNYRVSFRKIHELVGFSCKRTIEDGIRELRVAFEQGKIADYKEPLYSNLTYLKTYGGMHANSQLDGEVMAAFSRSLGNLEVATAQDAGAKPALPQSTLLPSKA